MVGECWVAPSPGFLFQLADITFIEKSDGQMECYRMVQWRWHELSIILGFWIFDKRDYSSWSLGVHVGLELILLISILSTLLVKMVRFSFIYRRSSVCWGPLSARDFLAYSSHNFVVLSNPTFSAVFGIHSEKVFVFKALEGWALLRLALLKDPVFSCATYFPCHVVVYFYHHIYFAPRYGNLKQN